MTLSSHSLHDSKISVVLAHKDPLVREGVAAILRAESEFSLGIAVLHASPGEAPFDRRRHPAAEVVVADYETALSLAEAAAAPSKWTSCSPLRIMVVSHRNRESEIRHALSRGVLGYLLLDSAEQEITDCVRALHRGQRHLNRSAALRVVEGMDQQTLTARETDVLGLIAVGHANKKIAIELSITVGTVKAHVKAVLSKLGAKSRTEAAAIAMRRGMLGLGW